MPEEITVPTEEQDLLLPRPLFNYHASALGFGGVLNEGGLKKVIPSLASVMLAPTGGEGWASADNYNKDGISFTRAESRLAGYETSPLHFTTFADVFITNLNFLDRFKVALMQATVISTRVIDLPIRVRDAGPDKTRFEIRVVYRGVELDGEEIVPELDVEICNAPTYGIYLDTIATKYAADPAGQSLLTEEAGQLPGLQQLQILRSKGLPVRGSVIAHVRRQGGIQYRNSFEAPGLGKFHLGELITKPDNRRLSLFRLEGFPQPDLKPQFQGVAGMPLIAMDGNDGSGGSATGGGTDTNGAPIWPG